MPGLLPLPIDEYVDDVLRAVRQHRAAVVTAAPGAGKSTRIPPALTADGPVLLLQPRRIAARAIARRIASERQWTVGREVGWQVRFERKFGSETTLLVATEGVLTARLQQDPLATQFKTIVIDEFHERSIHADVGLALAREAWRARGDLRLVVMSATMDSSRVANYLDDCPVIDAPGRQFPLDITYRAGIGIEDVIAETLPNAAGAILCFLPGAPEIRRTAERLQTTRLKRPLPVLPLHGSLDAEAQDAALRPGEGPRIILATNLAETTLTVPDVTCVIDSGLQKVARYDADRAIDSLETERISQDSADQRAGRAGRVQAGTVIRLWDSRDRLRVHREPEIQRVDLSATALDLLAWGADPRTFAWFESPAASSLERALTLLRRLRAIDATGALTALGRSLQGLPVHPRLGRMLLDAGAAPVMARACALLSERHWIPPRHGTTSCDLLSSVEHERLLPPHLLRVADEIRRSATPPATPEISDEAFRRAVFAGYPDRVARRRTGSRDRFVLASGTGARLGRESGVLNSEFIVAVELTGTGAAGEEPLVRIATGIQREWIAPTSTTVLHEFDSAAGVVRALRVEMFDALRMSEHSVAPDPVEAGRIIADEYLRRGLRDDDHAFVRRLAFAGIGVGIEDLVRAAAAGATRLADVDLEAGLAADVRRDLDRRAPAFIDVPSKRSVRLQYREGGVVAPVKLQEVFGLADSPRIGTARVPVTFELLSPAGRPVQVTTDLRSFWARGYPEVRKELRARYPKHPWPEDPWTAPPTAKPLRRKP